MCCAGYLAGVVRGTCMRRPLVLLIDLVLIGLATFLSLLLRDNLEFSAPRVDALLPYLAITLCTATAVLPALGIPRAILRFTGLRDYLRILAATAIIVSISVGICFAFNRMDGIARAIPILQALLVPVLLIGFRIAARMMHAMEKRPAMLKAPVTGQPLETVVVVGINAMTDLYMRTISDLAADRMRVAGLLGRDDEQRGLSLRQVPVLGTPDEILTVLNNLEVHGVNVDRIVVAVRMSDLSAAARAAKPSAPCAVIAGDSLAPVVITMDSADYGGARSRPTSPTFCVSRGSWPGFGYGRDHE